MKCKLTATDLKNLIKSMGALKTLGVNTKEEDIRCVFTVRAEKLYCEAANMGAYIRRNLPVDVLREGSCGVNLRELSKSRFSGDVTLDYDLTTRRLKITCSKSRFDLPSDQAASDMVASARPEARRVEILAKIPADLIIEGTTMVSIRPGLKEEDLKMQFCITKTDGGGRIEITGLDHFSFARYVKESPEIRVKENMKFILQSSSPGLVMKEITAKVVGIGVETRQADSLASLVRFASDDAEVYYPTLETGYLDAAEQADEIRQGTMDGCFVAYRKQLREALNTVKPVQDTVNAGAIVIHLSNKMVQMAAKSSGGLSGTTVVNTANINIPSGQPQLVQVGEKYFFEILTLAPDVLPLQVESWDRKFLSIKAQKVESGLIEFFMSQLDSQIPEQESKKKAS